MLYKKVVITIAIIVLTMMAIVYFSVNPENSVYMPKCIIKQLTGFDCPSCGVQRAVHAILHGDVVKAISYNPFFVIAVPYFLLVLYATIFKNAFAQRMRRIVLHRYALYSYIILFFAWWIARNIWFR